MSKSFTHRSVIVATFPRPETWRWTKQTVIGCLIWWSNGLMGGPWPIKVVIYSRPSVVSLATQDYCCCISSSFFFSCETMDLDQCCGLVVKLSNKKNRDAYASGTLLQISGGLHTVKFASCTLYTYTSLQIDLQYGLGWCLHDILYALGSSFQISLWYISPQ